MAGADTSLTHWRSTLGQILPASGSSSDVFHHIPSMEPRQVARVPCLAESRGAQVPVGADIARHRAQIVPEVCDRRAAPKPLAVIDAVNQEVLSLLLGFSRMTERVGFSAASNLKRTCRRARLRAKPTDRYFEGGSAGARTWAIVNPGGNFSLTSNLMYSMEPG